MIKKIIDKLFWVLVFSVAMGFLEAVVVVYLRAIFYPQGFNFPLKLINSPLISIVEVWKEIATIIMLFSLTMIVAKKFYERIAYFLFSFAVWDIFYYVFLKMILNWPDSFFTWDILFLIPVIWMSPVLAPIICSITMIFMAIGILYLDEKEYKINISFFEWIAIIIGIIVIIISFIYNFLDIVIRNGFLSEIMNLLDNQRFVELVSQYIPVHFQWFIFLTGEILIVLTCFIVCKKIKKKV